MKKGDIETRFSQYQINSLDKTGIKKVLAVIDRAELHVGWRKMWPVSLTNKEE